MVMLLMDEHIDIKLMVMVITHIKLVIIQHIRRVIIQHIRLVISRHIRLIIMAYKMCGYKMFSWVIGYLVIGKQLVIDYKMFLMGLLLFMGHMIKA